MNSKHSIWEYIEKGDETAFPEEEIHKLKPLFLKIMKEKWFFKKFHSNTPTSIPLEHPSAKALINIGLISPGGLIRYRVNVIREKIFITDAPWRIQSGGVFPFDDEAKEIIEYIDSHIEEEFEAIIDIGVGCGHVLLGYPSSALVHRVGVDNNERAGRFLRLNAALNHITVSFVKCDVNSDQCGFAKDIGDKKMLVTVDLPFAISPLPEALPGTSDGGRYGTRPTLNAISKIAPFLKKGSIIIANVYSLGNIREKRWQILDEVAQIVPRATVKWELTGNSIWRINGEKKQPNPMPITFLAKKADCTLYVSDESRDIVREQYRKLATTFQKEGWKVLGGGILEIRF